MQITRYSTNARGGKMMKANEKTKKKYKKELPLTRRERTSFHKRKYESIEGVVSKACRNN